MRHLLLLMVLPMLALFTGCRTAATPPAVTGFQADRYLGTWYEIARYPHRFERGMTAVTATYTAGPKGRIMVLNRGYDPAKRAWRSAEATAVFTGARDVGELKVTFFWPFAGAYKVVALDHEAYQWAIVASSTPDYFWLLARTPTLPPVQQEQLLARAVELGFDRGRMELVDQSQRPPEPTASP
jgi:apolipoprotein D and lipocalin family protein